MHSILVLITDPAYREKVCGEIVCGVRCSIYVASDLPAALTLLKAERPTILMLTHEFATIHGRPVGQLVSELSAGTAILFLDQNARAAALHESA